MNWNAGPVTIRRRRRNHSNVTLDPITKTFIQLNDPPKPEKQPKVELTEDDKKRVLGEFRRIFNREPDPDELEELYIEERKVKRGRRQQ